jgi:hypothetical protein
MHDTDECHIRHLTPIEPEIAERLCNRAQYLAAASPDISYATALEVKGFRQSRTPWDARRLARALVIDGIDDPVVDELFRIAFERAGLDPERPIKTRKLVV